MANSLLNVILLLLCTYYNIVLLLFWDDDIHYNDTSKRRMMTRSVVNINLHASLLLYHHPTTPKTDGNRCGRPKCRRLVVVRDQWSKGTNGTMVLCVGGIGETAVYTTIVRLLCVRTASLSGRILDRSYYIYILFPQSQLPRRQHYTTTALSTSSLYFLTIISATMTTTTTTMTMNATIPFITIYITPMVFTTFWTMFWSRYFSLSLFTYNIYIIYQTTFVYRSDGKSLLRDRGPMNLINWQRWYGANPASDGPGKRRVHDLYTYIFFFSFQRNNLHQSFVVRGWSSSGGKNYKWTWPPP